MLDIGGYDTNSVSTHMMSVTQSPENQQYCIPCIPSPAATYTTGSGIPYLPAMSALVPVHSADILGTLSYTIPGRMSRTMLGQYIDRVLYDNGRLELKDHTSILSLANTANPADIANPANVANPVSQCIYRMKGIICLENELYYYILQAVHNIFDLTPTNYLIEDNTSVSKVKGESPYVSKIIVIGSALDSDALYKGFLQCVV